MKNNKRGISLIVLIVTIIVIIILAAVVILTLSKNNPVESARKVRFMEDVRSFQDELALSVSKDYVTKKENRNDKFNATSDGMKEYIPSITDDYKDKLKIVDDELMYVEDKVTENEKNWLEELGIGTTKKSAAQLIEEDPKTYYGQYVLNYTTDHEETKDAVKKWQIFHSDGENIYLIADDYIDGKYVPNGKKNSPIGNNNMYTEYTVSFGTVYQDYIGSKDIMENSKSNKWISWVDKYPNSTNINIKIVAYMLDTGENVWGKYAGSKAEYAIGGPTLEMFVDSYNKTHEEKLACEEMDEKGYKIKKENGSYNTYVSGLPINGEMNNLYVIPSNDKAYGMWLASHFAYSDSFTSMIRLLNSGAIDANFNSATQGFRPVVCLKSDIQLKEVSGGFEIE